MIRPRPVNQEALDTSLARATTDVQARFALAAAMPDERPAGRGLAGEDSATDLPARTGRSAGRPGGWPGHGGWVAAATSLVVHPEDGKVMTLVDAGAFLAGEASKPTWQQGFYIDVYPTTNADYALFIAATGHRSPTHWAGGECPEALLHHPVVEVSWHDAQAYAAWASKALPSAQQWEKAARGPNGAPYPWGDGQVPARCNVRESAIGKTTPVDRYPDGVGLYGAFDLCGNVWEWCTTSLAPGRRAVKGGAFTCAADRAVAWTITDAPASVGRADIGFRCVVELAAMLELFSI